MKSDHEYLKRMQTEYGAVIQFKWQREGAATEWVIAGEGKVVEVPHIIYRICPIWLEERLKEAATAEIFYAEYPKEEEYEFKMGQPYYYINGSSCIDEDIWEGTLTDSDVYDMGNAYHTEEEAQVARNRQLARVRVERRIKELNGHTLKGRHSISLDKFGSGELEVIQHNGDYCPMEWQGTECTMDAVIKEMPEDITLAMGWDSE